MRLVWRIRRLGRFLLIIVLVMVVPAVFISPFFLFFNLLLFVWPPLEWGADLLRKVKNQSIRTNGKSAQATIMKIRLLDSSENTFPVPAHFWLDVRLPDGGHLRAEAEDLIPNSMLPGFQPGNTVKVLYDDCYPPSYYNSSPCDAAIVL
jgi:hypothetical protein